MTEHQAALDTMAYGVYVVTCKAGDKRNGLTVAWAAQVSFNPPIVAIAVNKGWYSHELLSEGDSFVLHVLAEDQVEIGKRFGTTHGWDTDKFEGLECDAAPDGTPIIRGCRAVLQCRKVNQVEAGDHSIFIGEVVSSSVDDAKKEQVLDRKVYFG